MCACVCVCGLHIVCYNSKGLYSLEVSCLSLKLLFSARRKNANKRGFSSVSSPLSWVSVMLPKMSIIMLIATDQCAE